jgi:ribosomal protein S18 acetylase RimI-like enzyme
MRRGSAGGRVRYRRRPKPADVPALRRLVASTGVFYRAERKIALELLEERLRVGRKSGYSFFFAERAGRLVGYCAWGKVPLTQSSYDLYWIAVAPAAQGEGIGRKLVTLVERAVARRGGGGLYIETSSRGAYDRTRRFYLAAGYRRAALLRDFYAARDDKVVFCKMIRRGR